MGFKGVHLQTSWLGREGIVGKKEAGTKDVSSFAGLWQMQHDYSREKRPEEEPLRVGTRQPDRCPCLM